MRIQNATYRLQLHQGFSLDQTIALVGYLEDLGVSDLYSSPLLMARPGSDHGYDVTDPSRLNPELGSERDLERLAAELRRRGMGLLLDTVPNHLCLTSETNRWWQDVLRHGRRSPYANHFDVYWESTGPNGRDQVTLPILGQPLDEAIEQGRLQVAVDSGDLVLRYYEHRLPLDPQSLPEAAHEIGSLDPSEREVLLDGMNTPQSLRSLVAQQAYRPVYWKRTAERVGYRRFFDINDLIGVRVEDPKVFADTHALLLDWIERGIVTGLRIDHIDGLRLPKEYLDRLQAAALSAVSRSDDAGRADESPFYVVVEKILARDEEVPRDWATAGTSGYEFLNALARLFVHPDGEARIRDGYATSTGSESDPEAVEQDCRRLVLRRNLHGSVRRLAERGIRLAKACRQSTVELDSMARAIIEVIAAMRVYRTYVGAHDECLSETDRRRIAPAVDQARRELGADPSLEFLSRLLSLDFPEGSDPAEAQDFVLRFQQLSGPAAAKGFEDTTLYRYVPLACENEVGADLTTVASSARTFHEFCRARLRATPLALNATSTHDTKRSEDARLRIAALSEMPDRWLRAFEDFRALNQEYRTLIDGSEAPDENDEYLFYQSSIGLLPNSPVVDWDDLSERLVQYMQKAVREAKRRSSWWEPDEAYEAAVERFVRRVLGSETFVARLMPLVDPAIQASQYTALSQTLLKIAAPGVPDFYQGTELFCLSLVDPDNRRPIDFARHRELLEEVKRGHEADPLRFCSECLHPEKADLAKLLVTTRALSVRREHPNLFSRGTYAPLFATGRREQHVVSFARAEGDEAVVVVAGRFFLSLLDEGQAPIGPVWGQTTLAPSEQVLPAGTYRDVFTGQARLVEPGNEMTLWPVEEALRHLPVALFVREP